MNRGRKIHFCYCLLGLWLLSSVWGSWGRGKIDYFSFACSLSLTEVSKSPFGSLVFWPAEGHLEHWTTWLNIVCPSFKPLHFFRTMHTSKTVFILPACPFPQLCKCRHWTLCFVVKQDWDAVTLKGLIKTTTFKPSPYYVNILLGWKAVHTKNLGLATY